MAFKLSLLADVFNCKFKMAKEPLGTGTLTAFDVNFPLSFGNALVAAACSASFSDNHI